MHTSYSTPFDVTAPQSELREWLSSLRVAVTMFSVLLFYCIDIDIDPLDCVGGLLHQPTDGTLDSCGALPPPPTRRARSGLSHERIIKRASI